MDGLGDHVVGAGSDRARTFIGPIARRHEDYGDLAQRFVGLDSPAQLVPRHARLQSDRDGGLCIFILPMGQRCKGIIPFLGMLIIWWDLRISWI